MKAWTLATTLLLAAFANTAVFAAKALTPKAQLKKAATHVVVGKVRSISSTTNQEAQYAITTYSAQIAIDRVKKGRGSKLGDVVEVRYLSRTWRAAVRSRVYGVWERGRLWRPALAIFTNLSHVFLNL